MFTLFISTVFFLSNWSEAATQQSSCAKPLTTVSTAHPKTVVGTGTSASCTEQAFATAVNAGGVITFNCGASPATIYLTKSYELRNDIDTTIDGDGLITLDGSKSSVRMFWAQSGVGPWYGGTSPFWRSTKTTVTFQNITVANGRETKGTQIPALPKGAPSTCSQGSLPDGGGGAIMVTDIVLHVLNSHFTGNHAALVGPDVGGGAIYALGSASVVVQSSHFQYNEASNAGAIGTLQSNLNVINSQFQNNTATGNGANNDDSSSGCPLLADGQYQTGSGGIGGAIAMDGAQDTTQMFCGDTFVANQAGVGGLGGAISRTADGSTETTDIDQSEFDSNKAPQGGAIYQHNVILNLTNSTFLSNSANTGGAVQADSTTANLANDTFESNSASVGWTVALFSNGGSITNSTFVGNVAGQVGPLLFASTPVTLDNNIFENNVLTSGSTSCSTTFPGTGNVAWPETSSSSVLSGCASKPYMKNPMLESLQFNGGFGRTMAIPSNSPANSYGTKCPKADERGATRPTPMCASGAYQPE